MVTAVLPARPTVFRRTWTGTPKLIRRGLLVAAEVAGLVAGHVWRSVTRHGAPVAGLVLVSVGAGQVYGPAGLIVPGVLLLLDRAVDDHRAARRGGGGR